MKTETTALKLDNKINGYRSNEILTGEGNNFKYERLKSRLSLVYFAALLASLIFLFTK